MNGEIIITTVTHALITLTDLLSFLNHNLSINNHILVFDCGVDAGAIALMTKPQDVLWLPGVLVGLMWGYLAQRLLKIISSTVP